MGKEAVHQEMPFEQRPGWSEARFSSSLVFPDCGAWTLHPGPGHPVADDRETGWAGQWVAVPQPLPNHRSSASIWSRFRVPSKI